MSTESPARIELLCELGVAQKVAGDFARGEQTLVDATEAADEGRDARLRLRAKVELASLRVSSGAEGSSAQLLDLAAQAVPIFEELGDERALGRTWRNVGYVRGIEGRVADWQAAVERALVHYQRSGWSASGCLAELGARFFTAQLPLPKGSIAATSYSVRRRTGPVVQTSAASSAGSRLWTVGSTKADAV